MQIYHIHCTSVTTGPLYTAFEMSPSSGHRMFKTDYSRVIVNIKRTKSHFNNGKVNLYT